jgi:hypothetical protein
MDSLKKLPALVQQHYEKVLLGLALAALVMSGLLLAQQKEKEAEELKNYMVNAVARAPSRYTNINWASYQEALALGTNPVRVDFTKPRLHNLFGPVKWQRQPDGKLLKIEVGNEVGPEALKITKIAPLYLTISLDRVAGSNSFFLGVAREASTNAVLRRKNPFYVTLGGKDRLATFTLRDVKGTPEDPELLLELADSGERASVLKTAPFQKVEGYTATLVYPPEGNRAFTDKRLNDLITLGGEDYIVVAISQNEVVLSSRSNLKRTILRHNAPP